MIKTENESIKKNNYFIFGYFGWNNSGDDAIGYSVLREIESFDSNARFSVTSNSLYFSQNVMNYTDNIKISFVNFSPLSIIKELIRTDFFIITGGTHFHDEDQYLLRRFFLFIKFYGLTLFARLIGKKTILLGHGIGPVSKFWSKILLKAILTNSKVILVRDIDSKKLVDGFGFSKKCFLGFDCATMLFTRDFEKQIHPVKTVGFSFLPAYSIYSKTPERDDEVIACIHGVICELLTNNPDFSIKLFAFRTGDLHTDLVFLNQLKETCEPFCKNMEIIEYNGDIFGFIKKIDECDFFIGMRYHSSLFAYLLQKPQIIIDYMGKCKSLAKDIDLPKDALIHLDNLDVKTFSALAQRLVTSPEQFKASYPPLAAMKRSRSMFESFSKIMGNSQEERKFKYP